MKRLTGDRDYMCIFGRASEITSNLNKIGALYDLSVLSSAVQDSGVVMVIVERRQRNENPSVLKENKQLPDLV